MTGGEKIPINDHQIVKANYLSSEYIGSHPYASILTAQDRLLTLAIILPRGFASSPSS
jgi:hypothetical protein